jgi:hypothetical protein
MSTTYIPAIDSVFSLFKTAIDAGSTAIIGYVPEIRWPGIESSDKPDETKFWLRISNQSVYEEQTALAGNDGLKRFTNNGLIFVQLFAPKTSSKNFVLLKQLAFLVKTAFMSKRTSEGVILRNARLNELSDEAGFHRCNVVVEYEYDEMGGL